MTAVVGNATPADTRTAGTIVPFDREHVLLKVGVSPREVPSSGEFRHTALQSCAWFPAVHREDAARETALCIC